MKTVKILLTETVDNLGIVGDVVEVRPGYARNYLLPRAMATDPTPGNIQRLAARRAVVEAELKARRADLEVVHKKLEGFELTMQRSANEQGVLFGGVSQHDIAEGLRAEGLAIEDRMVRIGNQIKRLDSYHIPVVLASDLRSEIKLWVVSDKPAEQVQAEQAEAAEAEKKEERARRRRKQDEAAAEGEAKAEKADKAEKPEKAEKAEKTEAKEAKPKKSKKQAEPKAE